MVQITWPERRQNPWPRWRPAICLKDLPEFLERWF